MPFTDESTFLSLTDGEAQMVPGGGVFWAEARAAAAALRVSLRSLCGQIGAARRQCNTVNPPLLAAFRAFTAHPRRLHTMPVGSGGENPIT